MKKRGSKDKKAHLEEDEHALWQHAASTITPLKKRGRVHTAAMPEDLPQRPKPARSVPHTPENPGTKPRAIGEKKKTAPPPLSEFDRTKVRKLRSGRAAIEARIDLHGMRQDEAHSALRAFLIRAQAKGHRLVLVITGKGRKDRDDRHEPFDMASERSRGILKRNVPLWLEEPDLRSIVVSYTNASVAHGGEGALYVHLRKPR